MAQTPLERAAAPAPHASLGTNGRVSRPSGALQPREKPELYTSTVKSALEAFNSKIDSLEQNPFSAACKCKQTGSLLLILLRLPMLLRFPLTSHPRGLSSNHGF
ncbi:hypothetical protein NQZ68_012562 [Dissostichus eleginoides]|nr:hypothetical protein NQZ68_012562 [Dissostichus eleginoides]